MAQIKSQSLWSQGGAASRITCQQRTTGWVSIPLKSGRCCKTIFIKLLLGWVSQSLWSQGGAASCTSPNHWRGWLSQSLWSQGGAARQWWIWSRTGISLNPFEVREVLQVNRIHHQRTGWVSIPLKSGRCCKLVLHPIVPIPSSQSLWSQGGAASLNQSANFDFTCLNPFEVREVLQAETTSCQYFQTSQSLWSQGGAARITCVWLMNCASLNPFEVREVLQACFTKLHH